MLTEQNANIVIALFMVIAVTLLLVGSFLISNGVIDILYLLVLYVFCIRYTLTMIKKH